jgi:dipeptidyl-peptidase-4
MQKINLIVILFITSISFSQKGISVESIYKTYQFYPKGISGFNGMKDGQHFTQISGNSITKHKITAYKESGETLLNLSDLIVEGETLSVDDYSFNNDETKLLLLTNTESIYRHSYSADYFIYDIKTKGIEHLDVSGFPQTLATFSPDGKQIAYIRNNNIFVKDLISKKTTQITIDGKNNKIINGTTDWVYEEEFAITQAFGWSPDSKHIAYLKFDESKVKEFTMEYNVGELYPQLYTFKYPKAGEDNSKVTVHIYSLETQNSFNVQLNDYEYIPRISWSNVNNILILQTLNRHQNEVTYNKIEQIGGNWEATLTLTTI